MIRKTLLFLLAFPFLFVAFASWYLRATPLVIPQDLRWPADGPEPALTLRYTGVAGFEVADGTSVLLVDPVITRYSPPRLAALKLRPDPALNAEVFPEADVILIKHSHFDHVVDAPEIALRTGAAILGSRNTLNLARSRGVPESQLLLAEEGATFEVKSFKITVTRYHHARVLGMDPFLAGTIGEDAGEMFWWQYGMDDSWAYLVESSGASVFFGGSGGVAAPPKAKTLILAAAGPKHTAAEFKRNFEATGARRLILAHFDNFFQPRSKGLTALPVVDLGRVAALAREGAPGRGVFALEYDQRVALPKD